VLLGHSSTLAMEIERFCGDNNFVPRLGHRCSQTATVKLLVAARTGISILPKIAWEPGDKKTLVYRKLSGQAPTREVVVIRHLQRYQSKGAELFLKLLRTTVAEFSATGEIIGEPQPAEPPPAG
jgi:LysR family hydrogen peroxide-inducible transcriptional activator